MEPRNQKEEHRLEKNNKKKKSDVIKHHLFSFYYFSNTDIPKAIVSSEVHEPYKTLLRRFREYLGLSKQQIAKLYCVSPETYRYWELSCKKRAGAPDLQNHQVLPRDFFKWYFQEKYKKAKIGQRT